MIDPNQQADIEAAAITHMDGYGTIAECATEYGVNASDVRWCVVHLKSSADARRRARRHREKHAQEKENFIDPHEWQAINTLAAALDVTVHVLKNGRGKDRWSHLERREVLPGEVKHGNQKYMLRIAPGSPPRPLDIGESWPPVSATRLEPETLRDGDAVDRDLIAGLHKRAELLEAERDEARAELDTVRAQLGSVRAELEIALDFQQEAEAREADASAAAGEYQLENHGLNLVIADAHAEIKALEARLALASDAPRAIEPDRAARIALGVGMGFGLIGAALLRRMTRGAR